MKFTVIVPEWRCGGYSPNSNGEGLTGLCNRSGYKCCLGFVTNQLGVPIEVFKAAGNVDSIFCITNPYEIPEEWIGRLKPLLVAEAKLPEPDEQKYFDTDFTDAAIKINDDEDITLQERIQKLKEHFASAGHEIEFVNADGSEYVIT